MANFVTTNYLPPFKPPRPLLAKTLKDLNRNCHSVANRHKYERKKEEIERKRKIVVECNSLKFFWFFKGNTVNVNCLQWLLQKLYWYHTFVQASKRPSVCLSFCSGNCKRIFLYLKVLFLMELLLFVIIMTINGMLHMRVAMLFCCLIFEENLHDFCNVSFFLYLIAWHSLQFWVFFSFNLRHHDDDVIYCMMCCIWWRWW